METSQRQPWIVVGTDGSAPAREALRWAARLAPLLGAEVAAVHGVGLVERLGGTVVSGHAHLEEIRALAERDWCGTPFPGCDDLRVVVRETSAVGALLSEVDELGAELVVVGTRGTGLASAQAIGSTTLRLLCQATLPVVVVPEAATSSSLRLRRLLVGVDGSPAAHAAVAWAARLASRTSASCDVIVVAEEGAVVAPGPVTTDRADGEEALPQRVRRLAEGWCEPLRQARVPYRLDVQRGDPAATLIEQADRCGVDLVVVGSSGAGSTGDPLLGSVSRHVAHDAGRAVAVVPDPARRADVPGRSGPAAPGRRTDTGGPVRR